MKNWRLYSLFVIFFTSFSPLLCAEELSLYQLVEINDIQRIENAIKKGIDLNEYLSMGETAFSNVSSELDWDLMKLLLDNGANPNLSFGILSVLDAEVKDNDLAKVKLLLDYGADVNNSYYITVYETEPFTTPLHEAVKQNNHEMITLLLTYGADVNIKDNEGLTALDYAVKNNKNDVIELIEKYKDAFSQ